MTIAPSSSLLPSTSKRSSFRSSRSSREPAAIDTVVTIPPWARDEPPSPDDDASSVHCNEKGLDPRLSAGVSRSSIGQHSRLESPSRWWTFTLPRNRETSTLAPVPASPQLAEDSVPRPRETLKLRRPTFSFRDHSMSWLQSHNLRRAEQASHDNTVDGPSRNRSFHTNGPPPHWPYTLAHSRTPGWDTPWDPIAAAANTGSGISYIGDGDAATGDHVNGQKWLQVKKKLTSYVLKHHHVPLIFRLTNIALTSAALAVAVHIRSSEARLGVPGAVGSSPTIVIIFAPLTLVHVMIAIYLDYFGRPLGLWRTSHKLAHTLFEVLFICAWSAALSLCFDNFFTSLVPCSSTSNTAWYNRLPRPSLPQLEKLDRRSSSLICGNQLALICLVGVGVIMYCVSLVINLFRIFEKIKHHRPTTF